MTKGFIKLHRKIQDHWIYQEERQFSRYEAWIDLLMMANHKQTKVLLGNELVQVQRGQVITSEAKLMKKWNWGKSRLRTFLEILENENMITKKSDRKKTTITIENYSIYHDKEVETEPQSDYEQTANRPSSDTIKNVKNVNNIDDEDNAREEKTENDALVLFDRYIHPISEYIKQQLLSWIDDLGEEIVCEAIKQGAESNAKSYKYINKILLEWNKNNLRTIEEVKDYIERKNNTIPFKPKKVANEIDWENL